MNKKKLLMATFVILVIGIVGYFALVKNREPITQQTLTPTPIPVQPPVVQPSIPTPTNEIQEWKTYQNGEYGFEMKYPNTWTVIPNKKDQRADDYYWNFGIAHFSGEGTQFVMEISIIKNEYGSEKKDRVVVDGVARDLMYYADNPCGGFAVNIPYKDEFLVLTVPECVGQCDPEAGLTLNCKILSANTILSKIISTFRFVR